MFMIGSLRPRDEGAGAEPVHGTTRRGRGWRVFPIDYSGSFFHCLGDRPQMMRAKCIAGRHIGCERRLGSRENWPHTLLRDRSLSNDISDDAFKRPHVPLRWDKAHVWVIGL